jgi:hypothetical protein
LQTVADAGANVLDVTHVRDGVALQVEETGVELLVECRDRAHREELIEALSADAPRGLVATTAAAPRVDEDSLRHDDRGLGITLLVIYPLFDVAAAWVTGRRVDFDALHRGETSHRVPLPTYPFRPRRLWRTDW